MVNDLVQIPAAGVFGVNVSFKIHTLGTARHTPVDVRYGSIARLSWSNYGSVAVHAEGSIGGLKRAGCAAFRQSLFRRIR